jgi:outer membrane protein assembly factor BamB
MAAGLLGGCSSIPLYGNPAVPGTRSQPPVEFFEVAWWTKLVEPGVLEYAPRELASPAYDPTTGYVIALTRDGYVRAVEPAAQGQGRVVWSLNTGHRFTAGAEVHEGVVYVPGTDGNLYALDVRTGEKKWTYAAGEALATTPVVADGRVLVMSASDTLFVVEAQTGKWLWQYRRDTPSGFTIHGASMPLVREGTAYLGFSDGTLVALDVRDGAAKWEKSLATGSQFVDVDTTPVLDAAGHLYAANYKTGLYALEAATGDVMWSTAVEGLTSLLGRGAVVFAAGDGRVDAYLQENGRLLWSLDLDDRAGSDPVMVKGMLLVPNQKALLFVDPATGRTRLAWNPGDGITASPLAVESKVFVLSNNGYLYALRVKGSRG